VIFPFSKLLFSHILLSDRWYYPVRVLDRALKRIGWQVPVETKCGIKYLGKGFSSDQFRKYVTDKIPFSEFTHSLDEFVINPDFLTDEYTLTGSFLRDSPHYYLVESLALGNEFAETDYSNRVRRGTLDLRKGEPARPGRLMGSYLERLQEVQSRIPTEIVIILGERNGSRFPIVVDGKHRLAMASYLNKGDHLQFSIIRPDVYADPLFFSLYELAKKNGLQYSKNLSFLETFYGLS
jgi:hypothetical protein